MGTSLNADDLLSADLQARLTYLGSIGDDAAWEIGDHAEDLIAEYPAVKPREVYSAIALYTSKPIGTIRSYHYLSARVPAKLRNAYPQIGRSHLKVLADAARGDELALTALMNAWIAERGVGTVDSMRLWLEDGGNGVMMWEKRLRRMVGLAERMRDDEQAPEAVCSASCKFLDAAEEYR